MHKSLHGPGPGRALGPGPGCGPGAYTMHGKKMLSKIKVLTQNTTVIIKWIPPPNVGPQGCRGVFVCCDAAPGNIEGRISLNVCFEFFPLCRFDNYHFS